MSNPTIIHKGVTRSVKQKRSYTDATVTFVRINNKWEPINGRYIKTQIGNIKNCQVLVHKNDPTPPSKLESTPICYWR